MELQETNLELVTGVTNETSQMKYRRIVSKVSPDDPNVVTFVAELESDRKWSWKNDVLAFLPESERQNWDCRCCRETFKRFATAVVATYNRTTHELSLKSLFWDPETVADELRPALEHINELLAQAFERKRLRPLSADIDSGAVWAQVTRTGPEGTGRRIGIAEAGGFGHIHAEIPAEVQVLARADGRFSETLKNFQGWVDGHRGLGLGGSRERLAKDLALLDSMATEEIVRNTPYESHRKSLDLMTDTFDLVMTQRLPVTTALTIASLTEGALERVYHFKSSAIGQFYDWSMVDRNTPNDRVAGYLNLVAPENYKRAQRAAEEREMGALLELVETKYPTALELEICTNAEVDVHWFGVDPTQPKAPAGEEGELTQVQKLRQMANRTATEAAERAEAVVDSDRVKKITSQELKRLLETEEFETVELAVGVAIRVSLLQQLKDRSAVGVLKAGVTHIPVTLGQQMPRWDYGLEEWSPLGQLKTPVTLDEATGPETLYCLALPVEKPIFKSMPIGLFADVYNNEFHAHRRAMETLLHNTKAPVGAGDFVISVLPENFNGRVRLVRKGQKVRQTVDVITTDEV